MLGDSMRYVMSIVFLLKVPRAIQVIGDPNFPSCRSYIHALQNVYALFKQLLLKQVADVVKIGTTMSQK